MRLAADSLAHVPSLMLRAARSDQREGDAERREDGDDRKHRPAQHPTHSTVRAASVTPVTPGRLCVRLCSPVAKVSPMTAAATPSSILVQDPVLAEPGIGGADGEHDHERPRQRGQPGL